MKKILSSVFLALACMGTTYAQDTQTKAAPPVPTAKITFSVGATPGGSDTLKIKKAAPNDGVDSVLFYNDKNNLAKSAKLVYGTNATLPLVADTLYMLESFTVNGKVDTLQVTFPGEGKNKGHNTYSKAFTSLTAETKVAVAWRKKPDVKVTANNSEKILGEKGTFASDFAFTCSYDGKPLAAAADSTLRFHAKADCSDSPLSETMALGTYYAKIVVKETAVHQGTTVILPIAYTKKKELVIAGDAPSSKSVLQAGQSLSAAVIEGVSVKVKDSNSDYIVKGTWKWANPNEVVKCGVAASANAYSVIFTPDSSAVYSAITNQTIGLNVKPVKTILLGQTTGGVVAIEGATADNTYVAATASAEDTVRVTLRAIPDAGYAVKAWNLTGATNPAAPGSSEKEVKAENVSFTADGQVAALFVKATRLITVTQPEVAVGTVKVMNGTTEVTTDSQVAVGTTLAIVATPADGYKVDQAGYTATAKAEGRKDAAAAPVAASSFIVSGSMESYAVSATFSAIPSMEHKITAAAMTNGSLLLKSGSDVVALNASVEEGSSIAVTPLPNRGYRLASLTVNTVAQDISKPVFFRVTKETELKAVFEKESYDVTVINPTGAEIAVNSRNLKYQEELTANATAQAGYKLVSVLVDNKPVANGSAVKVEGPLTVTAQTQELATLAILNPATETAVYNGKSNELAIRTASGVSGFTVTYRLAGESKDTIPVGAGTYTATITRAEDATYKALTTTRTLIVEKAKPGILKAPEHAESTAAAEVTVAGTWGAVAVRSSQLKADDKLTRMWFTPADPNNSTVSVVVPKNETALGELQSSLVTVAGHGALKGGSLAVLNGDAPVDAGTVYVNQPLTLRAQADQGYTIDWSEVTVSGSDVTWDVASHTLMSKVAGAVSISTTGLFKAKSILTPISGKDIDRIYTGKAIALTPADLDATTPADGWVISYDQHPINVGSYTVYLERAEDATYKAYPKTQACTLTIQKATIQKAHITPPLASAVPTGSSLSGSLLSGGGVVMNGQAVAGSFAWTTPNNTVAQAGPQAVSFTLSDNTNYALGTDLGIQSYVSLSDAASIGMTLKIVNSGSVTVKKVGGEEVVFAQGKASIPAGSMLTILPTNGTITAMTADGQATAAINTVNGVSTYTCQAAAADFTLTITMKGGAPDPIKKVEGVKLDKSTLALEIAQSQTLVATVQPADATDKSVRWMSSDEAVATVDANGKVTAVSGGKAAILVVTSDGGYTATCQVTVANPVGLDEELAGTHVYVQDGSIVIVPTIPLVAQVIDMRGGLLLNARIDGQVRAAARPGIYLVRLAAGTQVTVKKISVR